MLAENGIVVRMFPKNIFSCKHYHKWCFARFGTNCKILKTWKNTYDRVSLLVKLQASHKFTCHICHTCHICLFTDVSCCLRQTVEGMCLIGQTIFKTTCYIRNIYYWWNSANEKVWNARVWAFLKSCSDFHVENTAKNMTTVFYAKHDSKFIKTNLKKKEISVATEKI